MLNRKQATATKVVRILPLGTLNAHEKHMRGNAELLILSFSLWDLLNQDLNDFWLVFMHSVAEGGLVNVYISTVNRQ